MHSSRNQTLGFAERTKKNLLYIEAAAADKQDVHVVTQLTNSLLGLLVFPWEAHFVEAVKSWKLTDLAASGWPKFDIYKGGCVTLEDLMQNMRNGIAHRKITFSSESLDANSVVITIENRPSSKFPEGFGMRLPAQDLRAFCFRLVESVDGTVG